MSLVADYSDSDGGADSGDEIEASELRKSNKDKQDKSEETLTKCGKNGARDNFLITRTEQSSSDSGSDEEPSVVSNKRKLQQTKLDNPFRTYGDVNVAKEDSVFRNPFREKEEQRIAVLEHHVKMTENPETALTINGKKICWNYRKRKCYLGTQCPFAHDSDVPLTEEQLKEQKLENDMQRSAGGNTTTPTGIANSFESTTSKTHLPGTASVIAGGYDSAAFFSSPHLGGNEKRKNEFDDVEAQSQKHSKSKKRIGLTNSLIPSKKALNLYQKTKDK